MCCYLFEWRTWCRALTTSSPGIPVLDRLSWWWFCWIWWWCSCWWWWWCSPWCANRLFSASMPPHPVFSLNHYNDSFRNLNLIYFFFVILITMFYIHMFMCLFMYQSMNHSINFSNISLNNWLLFFLSFLLNFFFFFLFSKNETNK